MNFFIMTEEIRIYTSLSKEISNLIGNYLIRTFFRTSDDGQNSVCIN